MYHFSPRVSIMLTLAAALTGANQAQAQVQATPVSMSTTPSPSNSTPSPNANVSMHDGMPDRLISAQVHDGILSIDGMVAKVQLNYEIQRAGYMYFYVPGMGTAVVSLAPIPDAERVQNAIQGSMLSFVAGGHTFELSCKGNLMGRKDRVADVYVRLDRSTIAVGRYPKMGYGDSAESPYVWPLSAPAEKDRDAHVVTPPRLPASVLPDTEVTASTASPSKP